ncbi:alpha/beta hydrolase [Aquabacterium sp.]|uniref:alpha/beta hydrolase n=1 Tax=Aquabacterium sp. TaxID=1872578 RepID=UPI0035AF08C2
MQLIAWSHECRAERLTLRGWHSPPSGKPLLHFLHGNGFCGRVYEPMLSHLVEHFDLWLCDVQGHGDSDAGPRFLGWDHNATLALQAFGAHEALFGAVPKFAAGHSFGGVLTCLAMAQQPHRFAKAVALDPVLFNPTMVRQLKLSHALGLARFNPLAQASLKRRTHWPSRDDALNSLTGRGTYKGWSRAAMQAFVDHALSDAPDGVALKCTPTTEAAIFNSAPADLWKSLRHVRDPILVLHGRATFPFIAPSVSRWHSLNSLVASQAIEGGHCFMQEDPAGAARAIRSYLQE